MTMPFDGWACKFIYSEHCHLSSTTRPECYVNLAVGRQYFQLFSYVGPIYLFSLFSL